MSGSAYEFTTDLMVVLLALSLSVHVGRVERWVLRLLALATGVNALLIAIIAAPALIARLAEVRP